MSSIVNLRYSLFNNSNNRSPYHMVSGDQYKVLHGVNPAQSEHSLKPAVANGKE